MFILQEFYPSNRVIYDFDASSRAEPRSRTILNPIGNFNDVRCL
jgi:hypothetical protein